jgi:hypothetical protein
MTLEQQVVERLHRLPPGKQAEVLDFVDFLSKKREDVASPLPSLKGLWADLKINISEDDLQQVRKEMWGTFPREDV